MFPKSTALNRWIPKQKFYDKLEVSSDLRRKFTEQIKKIYWAYKLAPETINLEAGKEVTEIQVFEVQLNQLYLDNSVLIFLDKFIPYHILFLLTYENKCQAWIGYKEWMKGSKRAFKVGQYFCTEWMNKEDIPLIIQGFNMDDVYEGFVRQLAGDALNKMSSDEELAYSIERAKQKENIEKRIEQLNTKIKREKQLNRQIVMKQEIRMLTKELELL